MHAVALFARLVLAAVFLASAAAKIFDRRGAREATRAMGVPAMLAPAIAVLLPFLELLIAVSLVPAASAVAGAIGALILLGAFTAGITVNLVRGRRPECRCFGALHRVPIGPTNLVRNAVLAAGAIVVITAGGENGEWHGLSVAGRIGIVATAVVTATVVVGGSVPWTCRQGDGAVRISRISGP